MKSRDRGSAVSVRMNGYRVLDSKRLPSARSPGQEVQEVQEAQGVQEAHLLIEVSILKMLLSHTQRNTETGGDNPRGKSEARCARTLPSPLGFRPRAPAFLIPYSSAGEPQADGKPKQRG